MYERGITEITVKVARGAELEKKPGPKMRRPEILKEVGYCMGILCTAPRATAWRSPSSFAEPYRYWRLCLRSFAA